MRALRNIWYAAAWCSEIDDRPLRRRLLGEDIVFYRAGTGAVTAARNRCPHRFAPLHLGRMIDGSLQCPYHGLRFDASGACIFNPDGDGIVPPARLHTYPAVERYGLVWLWMGEPSRANAALIPEYTFLDDTAQYRAVTGYLYVKANYCYMTDNVSDIAHVPIVHGDTLSCEGLSRAKTVLVNEGDAIWANRLAVATPPPPIFEMMWQAARKDAAALMDHWAEIRWDAACNVSQRTGITPTGRPRNEGIETRNCHLMTPETESTTHYFWAICRDFDLHNAALDQEIFAGTEYAFVEQDQKILEQLQQVAGSEDFWAMKPSLLQADIGLVQSRRRLEKMIAAEEQATVG